MSLLRGRSRTTDTPPQHTEEDCLRNVFPTFHGADIRRDVFNALRRSGLSKHQAFDAMDEMERSYIIFGKLFPMSERTARRQLGSDEVLEKLVY